MSDTVMTPSQQIIAASPASQVHEFTDSRGRFLKWKMPSFLEQVRLLRAIGPEQAQNQPYVEIVNVACSIVSIDGVPEPKPTSERQIDATLERLGDEGIAAISAFMKAAAEKTKAEAGAAVASTDPLRVS